MNFKEYVAEAETPALPEDVISLTSAGWFFGRRKPDFDFARILFDRDTGTVKFEPIESREHIGVGYIRSDFRRGHTTFLLRNYKFVKSGIAPLGKYRKVEGEEHTYRFFLPSRQASTVMNNSYSRKERSKLAKDSGQDPVKIKR